MKIGIRGHRFSFGVEAFALPAARAISTIAPASTASTATTPVPAAFATRATSITAAFWTTFARFATGSVSIAAAAIATFWRLGRCRRLNGLDRCRCITSKQALDPAKKAFFSRYRWWNGCFTVWRCVRHGCVHRCNRSWRGLRCRCIGQHTLDDGRLLVGGLLRTAGHTGRVFNLVSQLVAGLDVVQARVVVLQAFQTVVGGLQRLVGHQQNIDALLEFDLGDFGALFVQQERSHVHRHLAQHGRRAVLEGLFLDDAQNLQCA